MLKKRTKMLTDGTFVFVESEDEDGVFYFFRRDGEILDKIDVPPLEFYHKYCLLKQQEENGDTEAPNIQNMNFKYTLLNDCKMIKMKIVGEDKVDG